jgi:hypothetical protein|tara:strand:- start:261 stop:584 length:324 start_codon:yes stop_codon:yes gene_type:complete
MKEFPNAYTSDFAMFLTAVLGIPTKETRKIDASKSLKQAISNGTFLAYVTEKQFDDLMDLVEEEMYGLLIKRLEELFSYYRAYRKREKYRRKNEVPVWRFRKKGEQE